MTRAAWFYIAATPFVAAGVGLIVAGLYIPGFACVAVAVTLTAFSRRRREEEYLDESVAASEADDERNRPSGAT